MMKLARPLGGAVVLLLAILLSNRWLTSSRLQTKINELQQERERLVEFAERLCASRRVAQVTVLAQRSDEAGRTVNELLWQEIGADGLLGRPMTVRAVGELVYFEAYVIKFDHDHVAEADPDRGTSVAMFRRVFGDAQAPQSGHALDGAPPLLTQDDSPSSPPDIWDRFWEFIERPNEAERFGVRVAQCEAPAVPLKTGQIWELTIDSDGGLNLKKIADEPPNPARAAAGPGDRQADRGH